MKVRTAQVFCSRIDAALVDFRAAQVNDLYHGPARPEDDDEAGWVAADNQATERMSKASFGLAEQPVLWADAVAGLKVHQKALAVAAPGIEVSPTVEMELRAIAHLLSVTPPQLYAGWVEALLVEGPAAAPLKVDSNLALQAPIVGGRYSASRMQTRLVEGQGLYLYFHLKFEGDEGAQLAELLETGAQAYVSFAQTGRVVMALQQVVLVGSDLPVISGVALQA